VDEPGVRPRHLVAPANRRIKRRTDPKRKPTPRPDGVGTAATEPERTRANGGRGAACYRARAMTASAPRRASPFAFAASPWLPVVLYAAVGLGLALGVPLVDPDEGRNAEVAREMAERGDLVIPHLAGLPYLDKPPGLFWAGAAFVKLLGPVPLAVRLPALLAALATLWLVGSLSRRLEPAGHARRTVALLAGAPLFAVLGAYVIFDMPLALCVTVVWTLLAFELERGASRARRAAMFAAVALGVLVKGPVMLAWALGGSVAAALVARDRRALAWLAWAPGWLVVLGVAGGWFALALQRHPEYARYAFLEESLERMTSGSFQREQPAWFVPAVLAAGALPWSLATPWRLPGSRATRVAAGFVLFALVFFTLSRSKLVTYVLPAFPALAWWAAECWGRADRTRGAALALAGVLTAVAIAAVAVAARETSRDATLASALMGAAVASALLVPVAAAAAARRLRALALAAAGAWTACVLALGGIPLAGIASRTSGADLARAVARVGPSASVAYESCYSPGTDFLLGRSGTVVSALGHAITSNYVVRYRDTLRARGAWTLADSLTESTADVLVRETRRPAAPLPPGWVEFHRDSRFVAYRRAPRP
jgi:4-amino-4-deoxy-L-arabinose transferase-like glycosyltransferase